MRPVTCAMVPSSCSGFMVPTTRCSSGVHQQMSDHPMIVYVDVICPVFNAQATIAETIRSALDQTIPQHLCLDHVPSSTDYYTDGYGRYNLSQVYIDVAICCFDDGSTDDSLMILEHIQCDIGSSTPASATIGTSLFIGSSATQSRSTKKGKEDESLLDSVHPRSLFNSKESYGAGYARNQAAHLRPPIMCDQDHYFLCLLDSDDIMHPHRIAEQVSVMMYLPTAERHSTLLGCTFNRVPADSTWHYTQWANSLSDTRLYLERFREVTVIQPTWMLTRHRFITLGGYITSRGLDDDNIEPCIHTHARQSYQLIHPLHDNRQTIRLAEDLRFFHAHLWNPTSKGSDGRESTLEPITTEIQGGVLRLVRTQQPLLTYRHRIGLSQSSSTSRKLLLQLRTKALEDTILRRNQPWSSSGFVIWGAGRDGKDFFKCLSNDVKLLVRCFVDVDEKKFGYYDYKTPSDMKTTRRIPIVHFGYLIRDRTLRRYATDEDTMNINYGRITKQRLDELPTKSQDDAQKSRSRHWHRLSPNDVESFAMIDSILQSLPVVICVAMYRTNGALEKNVSLIGRTEGDDLWHFC